jgi:putative transposase
VSLARSTYLPPAEAEVGRGRGGGDPPGRARPGDLCRVPEVRLPPRDGAQLKAEGERINHKRVARIMREQDLRVRPRRRFVVTTGGDHDGPIFPDLAEKGTAPTGPDQLGVADLTSIRILSGFVYLAVIPGAWSRRVVGWALQPPHRRRAGARRRAGGGERQPQAAAGLHPPLRPRRAVRGRAVPREAPGARARGLSVGRRGNPYDNAKAESFMKTLKREEVDLNGCETSGDAVARLPRFLDAVYNAKRLHSALGYLSPVRFEEIRTRKAA